jgi:hypothetical protein
MSIFLLTGLLRIIDNSDLQDDPDILLNNITLEEYHDIIHLIIKYADRILITSQEQCAWDMHDELRENGFHVFPGERDSFGWLSGCIQTKKGYILYG